MLQVIISCVIAPKGHNLLFYYRLRLPAKTVCLKREKRRLFQSSACWRVNVVIIYRFGSFYWPTGWYSTHWMSKRWRLTCLSSTRPPPGVCPVLRFCLVAPAPGYPVSTQAHLTHVNIVLWGVFSSNRICSSCRINGFPLLVTEVKVPTTAGQSQQF